MEEESKNFWRLFCILALCLLVVSVGQASAVSDTTKDLFRNFDYEQETIATFIAEKPNDITDNSPGEYQNYPQSVQHENPAYGLFAICVPSECGDTDVAIATNYLYVLENFDIKFYADDDGFVRIYPLKYYSEPTTHFDIGLSESYNSVSFMDKNDFSWNYGWTDDFINTNLPSLLDKNFPYVDSSSPGYTIKHNKGQTVVESYDKERNDVTKTTQNVGPGLYLVVTYATDKEADERGVLDSSEWWTTDHFGGSSSLKQEDRGKFLYLGNKPFKVDTTKEILQTVFSSDYNEEQKLNAIKEVFPSEQTSYLRMKDNEKRLTDTYKLACQAAYSPDNWDGNRDSNKCCDPMFDLGVSNSDDTLRCSEDGWVSAETICRTEEDYGKIRQDAEEEWLVCEEPGEWKTFKRSEHCSSDFLKKYSDNGLVVGDIPASECTGEVIYYAGYERLAGQNEWYRATGSCDQKPMGDSTFLNVQPCEDRDGDGYGSCHQKECNDNDASVNKDAAEVCDDGVDNNCNEEADYDGFTNGDISPAVHGDEACKVKINDVKLPNIDTSSGTPEVGEWANVEVHCKPSQSGIRSSTAQVFYKNSSDEWEWERSCNYIGWTNGDETWANFSCNLGEQDEKRITCSIDKDKSYREGNWGDYTESQLVTVVSSDSSSPTCSSFEESTCTEDGNGCEWCPECDGEDYMGSDGGACVDSGGCTYTRTEGKCGAVGECSSSNDCDPGEECHENQCLVPGDCTASCSDSCQVQTDSNNCNSGFSPDSSGQCQGTESSCSEVYTFCSCVWEENLAVEPVNDPEEVEEDVSSSSPVTFTIKIHEAPTPSEELVSNEMSTSLLDSHGTCSCDDQESVTASTCSENFGPDCLDGGGCTCRFTGTSGGGGGEECTEDSDCDGNFVCGSGNECVPEDGGGGGGSQESTGIPSKFPYWAECSIDHPPNNVQTDSDSAGQYGGYNFYSPGTEGFDAGLSTRTCMVSEDQVKTYYCVARGSGAEWADNLDDSALQDACNSYGFNWTGNYCCGEPGDAPESYNEPGQTGEEDGACYNSQFQQNSQFLNDSGEEDKSVIIYGGEFYGCNLPDAGYMSEDDDHNDSSDDNLIPDSRNIEGCSVVGDYYCTENGEWEDRNNPSSSSTCVKDSMNRQEKGICPDNTNCFYEYTGSGDNKQASCVEDKYMEDTTINGHETMMYCDGGDWTTRTKLVAEGLLNLVEDNSDSDYRLYCDGKEYSLVEDGNSGSTGTYCAIHYEENVVLGVALKTGQSIDEFIDILNQSYKNHYQDQQNFETMHQDDCQGTQDYNECVSTNRIELFYDNVTRTALVTTNPVAGEGGWGRLVNEVKEFFNKLFGLENELESNADLLDKFKNFNKLYVQEKEDEVIYAFHETIYENDAYEDHMIIQYIDFDNYPNVTKMVPGAVLAQEQETAEDDSGETITYNIEDPSNVSYVIHNPSIEEWNFLTGRTELQ